MASMTPQRVLGFYLPVMDDHAISLGKKLTSTTPRYDQEPTTIKHITATCSATHTRPVDNPITFKWQPMFIQITRTT